MHILLCNDDGYRAPGINLLAKSLESRARITVVAPERDRSGASNSLTLDNPIRAHHAENGFIYVDGTPTDCVHLAITGLLETEPDIVISGINAGGNLGDDVLYSGTVAAAMEGRFLGLPAVAVSLVGDDPSNYETAARAVHILLDSVCSNPKLPKTILNVNVPDVEWSQIQGFDVTRLGHRHKSEPVICDSDPRGRAIYWVGPAGLEQDAGPGTDFYAIKSNKVSVTPLHVDLTSYSAIDELSRLVGRVDTP